MRKAAEDYASEKKKKNSASCDRRVGRLINLPNFGLKVYSQIGADSNLMLRVRGSLCPPTPLLTSGTGWEKIPPHVLSCSPQQPSIQWSIPMNPPSNASFSRRRFMIGTSLSMTTTSRIFQLFLASLISSWRGRPGRLPLAEKYRKSKMSSG